jgi:hypothetical protein
MSGTVFVETELASAPAAGAADAEAAATAGELLAAAVVGALAVVAEDVEGPELAGAPVDVEVPDGVHAAARAATGRTSERRMFMGARHGTTRPTSRQELSARSGFGLRAASGSAIVQARG